MAVAVALEHTYAQALPELSVRWDADPAPDPQLVVLNESLAVELGLDPDALRSPAGVAWLTGAGVPDTAAQAYAGHQFGGFQPRLGDGRALLLGEVVDRDGDRRDLHLKGSGRTPFSRGGDGKAAVGPMLREYVIGEAMHALGVPTSRALAVVLTGETVMRETPLPGAILVRVAASHLRVGTFQYASLQGDTGLVRRLADYAIDRHHPAAATAERPYFSLLESVAAAQAALVARWMSVGFVHGVMNTDNVTISGETIDYGPCAFMDAFDPETVFSSIDAGGRYAYGNQPPIMAWNLARLADALLPLLDDDRDRAVADATAVVNGFAGAFGTEITARFAAKSGLDDPGAVDALLTGMRDERQDFTQTFRARQAAGNPIYVPRNHLVDAALTAATAGDLGPLHELVDAVSRPFDERPGLERYAQPAPPEFGARFQTFCGT